MTNDNVWLCAVDDLKRKIFSVMIKRKKRLCIKCNKMCFIFSKNKCKTCDAIDKMEKKRSSLGGEENDPNSEVNQVGKGQTYIPNKREPFELKESDRIAWEMIFEKDIADNLNAVKEIVNQEHRRKTLETELDKVFSEYSRLYYSNDDGVCKCYTCPDEDFYKGGRIQCGHYLPRSNYGGRWSIRNVRPQCLHCNYGFKDNSVFNAESKYKERMISEMGKEAHDKFTQEIRQEALYSIEDLEIMLSDYRDDLKFLKKEKNVGYPPTP